MMESEQNHGAAVARQRKPGRRAPVPDPRSARFNVRCKPGFRDAVSAEAKRQALPASAPMCACDLARTERRRMFDRPRRSVIDSYWRGHSANSAKSAATTTSSPAAGISPGRNRS